MKRRDFIKLAGASAALFPLTPAAFSQQAGLSRWNSYRLTYKVDLPDEGKRTRLWLPLPDINDTPHQFSQGSVWSGNAEIARFDTIAGTASPMFYAEWRGSGPRSVTVSSVVKTADRTVKLSYPRQSRGFIFVSPSKGQKYEAPEGADSHT